MKRKGAAKIRGIKTTTGSPYSWSIIFDKREICLRYRSEAEHRVTFLDLKNCDKVGRNNRKKLLKVIRSIRFTIAGEQTPPILNKQYFEINVFMGKDNLCVSVDEQGIGFEFCDRGFGFKTPWGVNSPAVEAELYFAAQMFYQYVLEFEEEKPEENLIKLRWCKEKKDLLDQETA